MEQNMAQITPLDRDWSLLTGEVILNQIQDSNQKKLSFELSNEDIRAQIKMKG